MRTSLNTGQEVARGSQPQGLSPTRRWLKSRDLVQRLLRERPHLHHLETFFQLASYLSMNGSLNLIAIISTAHLHMQKTAPMRVQSDKPQDKKIDADPKRSCMASNTSFFEGNLWCSTSSSLRRSERQSKKLKESSITSQVPSKRFMNPLVRARRNCTCSCMPVLLVGECLARGAIHKMVRPSDV